ncbi:MAG: 4Fe-4S binding protein [Dehalococcoidia bacterium]|jgi:NAD-dependent dihydropyrimidine dehydrogenase PreA subunit|nr:4Fe-4S binding protein [Dehalococcoidia bacterium]
MAIVVSERECFGCALCVLSCPEDAIKITSSFIVEIDEEKCTECLECLYYCPVDALTEA